MSATTRGDLNGLFHDLPTLPEAAPPPPTRRQRALPWLFLLAFVAFVAVATLPFYPLYHVPWFLFAVVGFILWRRAAGGPWHHHHHAGGGGRPSSTSDH
jgi:hypothetical protein